MTGLPDLVRVLREGATVTYLDAQYTVSRKDAGLLVLPSGEVVACDPFTVRADVVPLAIRVPPGRYPAVSWVLQDPPSRRSPYDVAYCAALQLVIRDEPVAVWEPALWHGDDLAMFAVDRGVACFMDLEAARALATWDEDRVDSVIVSHLADILVQQIDPETAANVIISDCGGDGGYGVWTGRTADGDVACFLTDFVVLDSADDNEPSTHRPSAPSRR